MNKHFLIFLLILGFTGPWAGCRKAEVQAATYKGVVVYNICGNVVIQSDGPEYLGENGWKDTNNPSEPVYDHVFKVANACDFGTYSQGDTINFVIVKARSQTCTVCLIYVATPTTAIPIRVIR